MSELFNNLGNNLGRFFDENQLNLKHFLLAGGLLIAFAFMVGFISIMIAKTFGGIGMFYVILAWCGFSVYWFFNRGYLSFKPKKD